MSLGLIKAESDALCKDFDYDVIPENALERIDKLRSEMIHTTGWTKKTEHLKLRALRAMWDAGTWVIRNNYQESCQYVNVANGYLETAIDIIADEWNKGVPDMLPAPGSNRDGMSDWLEEVGMDIDEDEFRTNKELIDKYTQWMEDNASGEEILSAIAFGRRMTKEGFESVTKKVNGKAERGWKVRFANGK